MLLAGDQDAVVQQGTEESHEHRGDEHHQTGGVPVVKYHVFVNHCSRTHLVMLRVHTFDLVVGHLGQVRQHVEEVFAHICVRPVPNCQIRHLRLFFWSVGRARGEGRFRLQNEGYRFEHSHTCRYLYIVANGRAKQRKRLCMCFRKTNRKTDQQTDGRTDGRIVHVIERCETFKPGSARRIRAT